jgi:hypothetical protein
MTKKPHAAQSCVQILRVSFHAQEWVTQWSEAISLR